MIKILNYVIIRYKIELLNNYWGREYIMNNKEIGTMEVSLRGGFADRNGMKRENTQMQFKNLDTRTRTMLINKTGEIYNKLYGMHEYAADTQVFLKSFLMDVFSYELNWEISYSTSAIFQIITKTIRQGSYSEVLSVIEYLAVNFDTRYNTDVFEIYNTIFKNEYVGYRFVDKIIVPITNEIEINEINEAAVSPYEEVNSHIDRALIFLSDRDKPDYQFSIQESICAVEAMCIRIVGEQCELGEAFNKLKDHNVVIPNDLKLGFVDLFGYTRNARSIHHAGDIGGLDVTFAEAKFMLVSCCAFVNYLFTRIDTYQ